jgi:small nuclear ribonucleoprotein (snRNP)-like protein
MPTHARLVVVAAVLAALVLPGIAAGQTSRRLPAQTFGELTTTLHPGQRVTVTTNDGTRLNGDLQSVDASHLVLRNGDRLREFAERDVRQVRRRGDRLWNGALIGAGAGAAAGALIGGSRPGCSGSDAGFCAGVGAYLGIPLGAVIGLSVDAMLPHADVLYERPRAQARHWVIVPLAGRGGGMLVTRTF